MIIIAVKWDAVREFKVVLTAIVSILQSHNLSLLP